jgi:hypothetical protein
MHKQNASLKSKEIFTPQQFSQKDINYYHTNFGIKPLDLALITAVSENNQDRVKQVLADGANVNVNVDYDPPHQGYTPLAVAIKNNFLAMAELLIDAGADVNAVIDTYGISDVKQYAGTHNVRNNPLLSYAIILNKPEMVQLLLQHGADVNKQDPVFTWCTPLAIAYFNDRKEIAHMLINAGAKKISVLTYLKIKYAW